MNELWKNNLRDIEPYVPGEQSKEKDIVKLNANENPYPPSPKAVEAIKNFDTDALRLYPEASSMKLKNAIAKFYNVKAETQCGKDTEEKGGTWLNESILDF